MNYDATIEIWRMIRKCLRKPSCCKRRQAKWVLQTTSTSSRRMLRFRYRGNQASSVVDICMKCGSSGQKSNIIPLRISIALPRWKRIGRICFLVSLFLPLLVFLLRGYHILDTCGILEWPQTLKTNVGLLLQLPLPSLTTNDFSAILRMCLSFTHQRWQATMTVHIWSQLIRATQ